MAVDRSFVDRNQVSTTRMRELAQRLSDNEMRTPVGEQWTVGIVFAHLAFWEQRVLYVLNKTEKDGKLASPEIDIFVNDLSLPLWAEIPPRQAVRIAIESAEAVDRRLAGYPPALLEEIFIHNKRMVERSLHRITHLDEADLALRRRAG